MKVIGLLNFFETDIVASKGAVRIYKESPRVFNSIGKQVLRWEHGGETSHPFREL